MNILKNLFKKTCFLCIKKFKGRKADQIHVKTEEGILKVHICKKCADGLELMKIKDFK